MNVTLHTEHDRSSSCFFPTRPCCLGCKVGKKKQTVSLSSVSCTDLTEREIKDFGYPARSLFSIVGQKSDWAGGEVCWYWEWGGGGLGGGRGGGGWFTQQALYEGHRTLFLSFPPIRFTV